MVLAPAGEVGVCTALSGLSEPAGLVGRGAKLWAGGARKDAWQQPGGFCSFGREMEGKNLEQKLRDKIFPPVVVIRFFSENCIFILANNIQIVKASKEPNASSSCEKGR